MEKNIVEKAAENPKLFYKSVRSQFSIREQLIRQRDSEGNIIEDNVRVREELSSKCESVFKM